MDSTFTQDRSLPMTFAPGLLLLARTDTDCFAVIRQFEAESTNTCWFGFKSGGLPGECGKCAGCELKQRFSGAFATGGLAIFRDNGPRTLSELANCEPPGHPVYPACR